MNKLIIIIPGIFQDTREYDFLNTYNRDLYNFYIYNYPRLNNPELDFNLIIKDFNAKISDLEKKHDSLYLVTYSSGSELFLRSSNLSVFDKIVFLSPSVFIRQNISNTLEQSPLNQNLLQFDTNVHISKKLAADLDSFKTSELVQPNSKIWRVFAAKDDQCVSLWKTEITHLNHAHEYSQDNYIESFENIFKFFEESE